MTEVIANCSKLLNSETKQMLELIENPSSKNPDGSMTCNYCPKVYKQMAYMRKHLVTHGYEDDIKIVCSKCKKEFESQKQLSRHEKMKGNCLKK